ncbi:uncharacterized protein LOC119721750 [Patiria miniata]|uniref:DUF4218 domain-containing protein n=1 Tax=Patiria miniata TaxID=46514 RepID=A0A913Z7I0_PATMI|nr:uncharacterized protein LOC119721750 [Patiria miniata]
MTAVKFDFDDLDTNRFCSVMMTKKKCGDVLMPWLDDKPLEELNIVSPSTPASLTVNVSLAVNASLGHHHHQMCARGMEVVGSCHDFVLFGLFTGRDDTVKMRAAEMRAAEMAMDRHQHNRQNSPWTLTSQEKKTADDRLLQVRVLCTRLPSQFSTSALPYMKCSDWKKLASNSILKYAFRDMFGDNQQQTFFQLCDVLAELMDHSVDLTCLAILEEDMHHVPSLIERDFPLGIQTLCMYIMHHACATLKEFGPASSQWMYGFERFMAFLRGGILNRRLPEANAIEAYRIYEFSQFIAMAGLLPEGSICTSNTLTVLAATEDQNKDDMGNACILVIHRFPTSICIVKCSKSSQNLKNGT